jgi:hypothetical protein
MGQWERKYRRNSEIPSTFLERPPSAAFSKNEKAAFLRREENGFDMLSYTLAWSALRNFTLSASLETFFITRPTRGPFISVLTRDLLSLAVPATLRTTTLFICFFFQWAPLEMPTFLLWANVFANMSRLILIFYSSIFFFFPLPLFGILGKKPLCILPWVLPFRPFSFHAGAAHGFFLCSTSLEGKGGETRMKARVWHFFPFLFPFIELLVQNYLLTILLLPFPPLFLCFVCGEKPQNAFLTYLYEN